MTKKWIPDPQTGGSYSSSGVTWVIFLQAQASSLQELHAGARRVRAGQKIQCCCKQQGQLVCKKDVNNLLQLWLPR